MLRLLLLTTLSTSTIALSQVNATEVEVGPRQRVQAVWQNLKERVSRWKLQLEVRCERLLVDRGTISKDEREYRQIMRQVKGIFAAFGFRLKVNRLLEGGTLVYHRSGGPFNDVIYYNPPMSEGVDFARDVLKRAMTFERLRPLRSQGVAISLMSMTRKQAIIDIVPPARAEAKTSFLKIWSERARRKGLTYVLLDDEEWTPLGSADHAPMLVLNAMLLNDMLFFERVLLHESVHGTHMVDSDFGRLIMFDPVTSGGSIPSQLPGAHIDYLGGMISGEFEAQMVSAIGTDPRSRAAAWPHLESFVRPQVAWLRALEREFANRPFESLTNVIEFEGVAIKITMPSPKGEVSIDDHVRGILKTRIRHLENIAGIRARVSDRSAPNTRKKAISWIEQPVTDTVK